MDNLGAIRTEDAEIIEDEVAEEIGTISEEAA